MKAVEQYCPVVLFSLFYLFVGYNKIFEIFFLGALDFLSESLDRYWM